LPLKFKDGCRVLLYCLGKIVVHIIYNGWLNNISMSSEPSSSLSEAVGLSEKDVELS